MDWYMWSHWISSILRFIEWFHLISLQSLSTFWNNSPFKINYAHTKLVEIWIRFDGKVRANKNIEKYIIVRSLLAWQLLAISFTLFVDHLFFHIIYLYILRMYNLRSTLFAYHFAIFKLYCSSHNVFILVFFEYVLANIIMIIIITIIAIARECMYNMHG